MESYILYPNGNKCPLISDRDDGTFPVSRLQDIVGGYIGVEDIGDTCIVFDDDGDLNDKPYNREATVLVHSQNDKFKRIISGPAVVCAPDKIKV